MVFLTIFMYQLGLPFNSGIFPQITTIHLQCLGIKHANGHASINSLHIAR